MHFQLTGLPVLSQQLIVKHYIILRSPKPNHQRSFRILSQLAISEHDCCVVSRGRLASHKSCTNRQGSFLISRAAVLEFYSFSQPGDQEFLGRTLCLSCFFWSQKLLLPELFQSRIGTRRKCP